MGPDRQGPLCLQDRTDWDRPDNRTGPDRTGFGSSGTGPAGTGWPLGPDRTVGTGECPTSICTHTPPAGCHGPVEGYLYCVARPPFPATA
jgi:hypothetical protein